MKFEKLQVNGRFSLQCSRRYNTSVHLLDELSCYIDSLL